MRIAQASTAVMLVCFCLCSYAQPPSQKLSVTGTLSRVMAIGAESTGWAIQLDSETTIDGKPVVSIQVSDSHEPGRLESLADKRVTIVGKVAHRHGVETGAQPFLEVFSIKEVGAPFSLSGSEWLLEDLGGHGVIDRAQATLTFPEAGKVGGKGSCNRFFGPSEISGDHLRMGPLGSTRMACPEAVMKQETKYLAALQAADRFEWKDPYLLVYCKGWEKPLRFTRLTTSVSSTEPTDQWLGRWDGPEGTYLRLTKHGNQYAVEISDLDGPKTFEGVRDGNRIRFTRDGKTEFISAGDGQASGMKWLADKKNCLLTKPGEGWCRD
jgi:heat shock protein HslJ